jgi:flagellar L-ring protein FlgH
MKHSITLITCVALGLSGCTNTLDRLEAIGEKPAISKTENPQAKQSYQPMTWPLPAPVPPSKQYSNSLWQPGARAFFRDQRASRVGDILRVRIAIDDRADLDNQTERRRDTQENINAPRLFGLENLYDNILPGSPDGEPLSQIQGRNVNRGQGTVQRQEQIETEIAAAVTQVLPNGNFVIHGSQEIRVNFEMREIAVTGIVRPEDIDSTNTIESSQIAEARIVYGGEGQLTDIQQPRWGSQVIDIISPF